MWPGCNYTGCTRPVDKVDDLYCGLHQRLNRQQRRQQGPVDPSYTKRVLNRDMIKRKRKKR